MNKIFEDSQDYTPQAREIVRQYADEIAIGAIVLRTPVSALVKLGLKAISLGQFDNDIFHLFLQVYFQSGKSLLIEKNAVINFIPAPNVRAGSAMEKVGNWFELSFSSLLEGAKRVLGPKYFTYDAKNNNCQDYIMAILTGSGLGTPENFKFIKQDTRGMFKGLKKTRTIVKGITRLGGIVDRLIHGVGTNKISHNTIMPRTKGGNVEGEPVLQAGGGLRKKRMKKMTHEMMESPAEEMVEHGMGLYAGMGVVHHHHHYHGEGVGKFFKKAGKQAAKAVVTHALPYAATAVGTKAGMMLGGPAGALVGAQLGHQLGSMGADEANKAIGDGLYAGRGVRKGRFPKGSQEAKEYMQKLRSMRK
jgi:hypothetical protein